MVAAFSRSCLPGRTFAARRTRCDPVSPNPAPTISKHLHTMSRQAAKSFPAEWTYSNIHPRRHRGWIALVSHRIRPHTALSATVWRNFDRMLPKCIPLRVKDARATYAEQKKNGTVEPLRRSCFRALLTVAANRSVKGEQPKVPFFYEDS
jgi:hypothetical protein